MPADAEIVLEGYLDAAGYVEREGPYGEYLGYYGLLKRNPVKPTSGTEFGGAFSDLMLVPFADHMLVGLPEGVDPMTAASASDNIADGWRAVAPHLKVRPGASVLVVGGGAKSVGLYAAGIAVALEAGHVLYLDDDEDRRRRERARCHRRASSVSRPGALPASSSTSSCSPSAEIRP